MTTEPERRNLNSHIEATNSQQEGEKARSAFRAAIEKIEQIKTKLRAHVGDLKEAARLLSVAEKEQGVTSKEIEAVRSKLREIQDL